MFDHDHVPGHQVGGCDPGQLVIREVPRLYPEDHSERGADHDRVALVRVGGGDGFGRQEGLGVLGVVGEYLRGQRHFSQTLGVQLAHFQGEQVGELVGPFGEDGRGSPAHGGVPRTISGSMTQMFSAPA